MNGRKHTQKYRNYSVCIFLSFMDQFIRFCVSADLTFNLIDSISMEIPLNELASQYTFANDSVGHSDEMLEII